MTASSMGSLILVLVVDTERALMLENVRDGEIGTCIDVDGGAIFDSFPATNLFSAVSAFLLL